MTLHEIILFLHIIGALGFGAGALMSIFVLWALRGAQCVEQVRSTLGLLSLSGPVLGICMLVNVTTGLYMTEDQWTWQTGWIDVAIASVGLYFAVGAVMGMRRNRIEKLLENVPDGTVPELISQRIYEPVFGSAIYIMLALVVGIVFLMTVKPTLAGSIAAIAAVVVLAGLTSFPMWRSEHGESVVRHHQKQEAS